MIRRAATLAALLLALAWPAVAAELVMFELPGCPICARWDREVGKIYPKTPEAARAPLRRTQLGGDGGLALQKPVLYSPTFVLAENGREVGRMTGYTDDATFWGLMGMLLARLPVHQAAAQSR